MHRLRHRFGGGGTDKTLAECSVVKGFLTMNHINKVIRTTQNVNISGNSMSLLVSTGCNPSNLNFMTLVRVMACS